MTISGNRSIAFATTFALLACSQDGSELPLRFEKSTQQFAPRITNQIGLGDFDNDGDLDAVFSTMGLQSSSVLLNVGSGRFEGTGQELTQQGHGVGIGDLDLDGDLDLFLTCAGWNDGTIDYHRPSRVYLNDGTAHFVDSGQDLGDSVPSGNSVDLFDYDGDGDLDAFVRYYQLPDKVYVNDGTGYFDVSELTPPENVTWTDLDSDGDIDWFVRMPGEGFKTALNDGRGNFHDHWVFSDTTFQRVLAHAGDLNGDGSTDVVVTHGRREGTYSTKVFLNDGSGRMILSDQELPPVLAGRVGFGDLDADGDTDILLTSLGSPHSIWLNTGDGHLIDSGLRLTGNGGSHSPLIADLDGDDSMDIFVAHYSEGGANEIWFNRSR